MLWWTLRQQVFVAVGGLPLMMAWWRRPAVLPAPRAATTVAVTLVSMLLVFVCFARPDLPLLWLPILGAAWAGLVLTPFRATAHSMAVACVFAFGGLATPDGYGYTDLIGPSVIVDAFLVVVTYTTMLLVLFRDQSARLRLEVTRSEERAQAARVAAEQRTAMLSTVFETMGDGLAIFEPDRRVRLHNRAMRTSLGRPFLPEPPPSWVDYFGIRCARGEADPSDSLLLAGEAGSCDVVLDRDGELRRFDVQTRPLVTDDGEATLLLLRDVTAEHARHEELASFAGTVAHDLRSPLTALHGWLEQAQDDVEDGAPDGGRAALARSLAASQRLRAVIDDWLAYTVTRAGALRASSVRLSQAVRDVTGVGATRGGVEQVIEVRAPHFVHADPTLTRQLLANLISNAVKYTPRDETPHIVVTSRRDTEPGWVRVEVADRGVGLQPGDEERIFAAFTRSDKDAEAVPGTGLGLALCRSIVSRHGGVIEAYRNVHGGATFAFTLPEASQLDLLKRADGDGVQPVEGGGSPAERQPADRPGVHPGGSRATAWLTGSDARRAHGIPDRLGEARDASAAR